MEIWAGFECTLNRVGSRFNDQFARCGHLDRAGDLTLLAQLGIRTMRYPVHWERVQPVSPRACDWSFPDRQLARLQELRIKPIVGLLHHGSGPAWTHLLDPDFPQRLAEYAWRVAQRYPHVRDFTPVNEPLTTARFSALYGHWYPHGRDDSSFVQALLNQIDGTQRAMEAIRSIIPEAHLVQTEDVSKIFSTSRLAYQAKFENDRRWSTFDLLLGHFNDTHPLWTFFCGTGVNESQLQQVAERPIGSVLLGVNYYVTSERWLDEDLSLYPPESHGGNGRHAYADVAAVRGCPARLVGLEGMVREVWDRYHVPMAITESHLGCTREEQLRWLMETWEAACRLERLGVDMRAITAWAMLGAFDWNSLVTAQAGVYEPGAFDIRSNPPRPTQIASAVRQLVDRGRFDHPVLHQAGWWRRAPNAAASPTQAAPILILGGSGNVGRALRHICEARGLVCQNLSRYEADVCDPAGLKRAVEAHRPWAVINASGYTSVDEAEHDRVRCFEINHTGALNAARVCARAGLPCVTISTDLVFDGLKAEPYVESDRAIPLNAYGESKECGEQAVLRVHPGALIIRTSALFDPWSSGHFAGQILRSESDSVRLPTGRVSPTYTIDFCHALLDLLIDEETGIWHLANAGDTTWTGFAEMLFAAFSLPAHPLRGEATAAPRPAQSVLRSERGSLMPTLDDALSRFARDFQPSLSIDRKLRPVLVG